MLNLNRRTKPEVNTFSTPTGEIKFQVEDFRDETGLDQRWEVTIELGEQVIKMVVPVGKSGEVKILNSSDPTGSTIIVKNHSPGIAGSQQPDSPAQETPYFDEWVQSVFARRIIKAGLNNL